MDDIEITIRRIADIKNCRSSQELLRQVWESNDLEILPTHALITIAKNGGVILGAYSPNGPLETNGMVGIVLGWPGLMLGERGEPLVKHCSHQIGVLPAWRGNGVGLMLKLAQREAVLAQGVTELATWTYDPLRRANGVFNIHRLGATSDTYIRELYGEMDDALNVGLPTDRLQVDWKMRSERVISALGVHRSPKTWLPADMQLIPCVRSGNILRPGPVNLSFDGTPIAIPLPDSMENLRKREFEILIDWRLFLRTSFEQAFDASYKLVDCIELPQRGWHYILTLNQPPGT